MRFNVNEYVKVKLTPHGHAVYAANFAVLVAQFGIRLQYVPPLEDEEGWSKWQLWELMREFGPNVGPGLDPCFETVIEIPQKASLN